MKKSSGGKLAPKKLLRRFYKKSEETNYSRNTDCDMQSVDLNADFTETTENSSNYPATPDCPDANSLHQQIANLNETVTELENSIQVKDLQVESIRRDNERLSSEIKKQQRCNRSLKQQLDDERYFYQKEKEHFYNELQNCKSKCICGTLKTRREDKIRESLINENKRLKIEVDEKSETTYNLCIKFLRMKHAKDSLQDKLDLLTKEHLRVMAEMMEKLDEAKEELNVIISEKFKNSLPLSKSKFLQVVQRNTRLIYENAALKVQIQHLTQNIEKIKSETNWNKIIKVDSRVIEKLGKRCRKNDFSKCVNSQYFKKPAELSISDSTTCTSTEVDQSGDAKLASILENTQWRNAEHSDKEMSQSVVQLSTFRRSSDNRNISERSIPVRDMSTNT